MTVGYPPSPYSSGPEHAAPEIDRSDDRRFLQLIGGVLVFAVAQVVVGAIIVAGAGTGSGGSGGVWQAAGALLLGGAVSLLGYVLIMRVLAARPGLGLRGAHALTEFAVGAGFGLLMACLPVALIAVLGGYRIVDIALSSTLLAAIAGALGAALMHEVLFRGFVLRILDAWLGSWPALILSALIYGAAQLGQPGVTVAAAAGIALQTGLVLGLAYLLTRRLWLVLGIQMMFSASLSAVFGSSVAGLPQAPEPLLRAEISGAGWLTGGDAGLQGSLLTTIVFLAAAAVLALLARRHGAMVGPAR